MYYVLAGKVKFYPQSDEIEFADSKKKVEPQVSQLLLLLVSHSQNICTKQHMLDTIWSGRVVTDDSVRALIRKLRDELGDDVKSPKFIKTHPRVGYQLICEVQQQSRSFSVSTLTDPRFLILLSVVVVILGTLLALFDSGVQNKDPKAVDTLSVTPLTQLPGSELSPDYSPATQRLVFSYRDSHDALLSLYVKNMSTDTVQRLSHDDYNYINALWSADGKSLFYSRFLEDESQHYHAQFDAEQGLVAASPLPLELNDWYLKSSGPDNKLYVVSAQTPRSVAVWDPQTRQLQRLTSPEKGEGDIYAAPSADGTQLAVIRVISSEQRQLMIMDLATGTLVYADELSVEAYRLIWTDDDQAVLLSTFSGELLRLTLQDKTYTHFDLSTHHINHPFYDCGEQCVYARQHNGNYVDIAEQVSPFSTNTKQALLKISTTGVEDFPLYGHDGTVLFVQQQRDGQWLMEKPPSSAPEKLFLLPASGQLQALTINDAKTHLAGKLANRIFYFDLQTLHFQWLSQESEFYPHFVQQGDIIRFSRKDAGIFQSHFFNVHSKESYSVAEAIQFVWESEGSGEDRRSIIVDTENQLWIQHSKQAAKMPLTLPSASPNRFKILDDALYFSHRIGNVAWLSTVSLTTFEVEKRELAKNRLRLHFDISPNSSKILGVNSVLAQSNLVKVETGITPDE